MTPIAPAATVVLGREVGLAPAVGRGAPEDAAPEVFFVKRHGASAFMANAWVFPGGRLDPLDRDPRALDRVRGVDADALAARMHGVDDPESAVALLVCAARETFEEAGVLLARSAAGAPLDQPTVAALTEARRALIAGQRDFAGVLEDLELWLDGRALVYFDHWITPPIERRRFDTRFFVARAPAEQPALHDATETIDSCWATAPGALARHAAAAGFGLSPPTFWVIHELASHATLDDVERWARAREVSPVRPAVVSVDGRLCIALPGDPLHPGPSAPGGGHRRMIWGDGAWIRG